MKSSIIMMSQHTYHLAITEYLSTGCSCSLLIARTVFKFLYNKNTSVAYCRCLQCQCQSKFFSVAKTAELLRSPQGCSRVTIQNQEMMVEKEMFLGADGKK